MSFSSYTAPESIEGALTEIARFGDRARVLAGGTDLILQIQAAAAGSADAIVNIKRVPDLRGVSQIEGGIKIGTLTSVTDILVNPLIAKHAPILRQAADSFASVQIRNAATIGGNLINASPAADLAVPLLVLDARVQLARLEQGQVITREIPLNTFFAGPGQTDRAADEMLTAVILPSPPEGFQTSFHKAGTRPALDISVVSTGIGFIVEDGIIRSARVALGAVAPTPMRSRAAEQALEGQVLNETTAGVAAEAAAGDASPIDDVRASAWYRRHLLRTLVKREVINVGQS